MFFNDVIRWGGSQPFSFGNALQFDGVNDYLSILASSIKTISFWFKVNNPSIVHCTFHQVNGSINRSYIFPNDRIMFYAKNFYWTSGVIDYSGGWNHCYLWQDSQMHVMVNGIEANGTNSNSLMSFNLFGAQYDIKAFASLTIDEMILSQNDFSKQDGINLYNNGNGIDSNTIITTPLFHLKFNETAGDSIAVDSSENEFNGTLNNFDTSICWVAH